MSSLFCCLQCSIFYLDLSFVFLGRKEKAEKCNNHSVLCTGVQRQKASSRHLCVITCSKCVTWFFCSVIIFFFSKYGTFLGFFVFGEEEQWEGTKRV